MARPKNIHYNPNTGRLVVPGYADSTALTSPPSSFQQRKTQKTLKSKGRDVPAIVSLPMPATAASIVVFGDSITAGQNASTNPNRWSDIVASSLGATLLNQGIAGTVLQNSNDSGGSARTNNGRDRYNSALLGGNKKEMCIIAYGFNDARYIGAPATFNRANYENDYREILTGLIAGGYGADDIVIVSPYYITDTGLATGSTGFAGQTRSVFETFVDTAKNLAAEFGTYYCDTYVAMRDNGGATLIDTDNIHPKNNGHAIIAATILAAKRTPIAEVPAAPDTTAPTITSSASPTVAENQGFSLTLTANESVTWTKTGGSDQSLFTLTGNSLTMTAKDYETPTDSNTNNTYVVQVTATDAANNATNQTITVTVTDAAEGGGAFLNDTFTDTNGVAVTAHTPETGGSWVAQTGYTPSPNSLINNNRLYAASATGVYRNTATPPSADYYVECVLDFFTTVSADNNGVTGRASDVANTFYFARWSQTAGGFQLFKCVAGTNTQLGSTYTNAFTSGSRTVRLTMTGTTIAMSIDGTERVSVTDSSIAAAGFAGIRGALANTTTTGIHMTSITAA